MRPKIVVKNGVVTIQDLKVRATWKEYQERKRTRCPWIVIDSDSHDAKYEIRDCYFNGSPWVVEMWDWFCDFFCRPFRLLRWRLKQCFR